MEKLVFNKNNDNLLIEYLAHLKVIKNYSQHTLRNYTIDITQFAKFLFKVNSDLSFLDTDKENIKEFLFSLHAKKISNKTIARKVATLKSFYNYMHKNNIIDINIMK